MDSAENEIKFKSSLDVINEYFGVGNSAPKSASDKSRIWKADITACAFQDYDSKTLDNVSGKEFSLIPTL